MPMKMPLTTENLSEVRQMFLNSERAVLRDPHPHEYLGLGRVKAEEIARALCIAAANAGCYRYLPRHLDALRVPLSR